MSRSPKQDPPIEFSELGQGLMEALVNLDEEERKAAVAEWKQTAEPELKSAVTASVDSLLAYVNEIAEKGDEWKPPSKWWDGIINVSMEIKLVSRGVREVPEGGKRRSEIANPPPEPELTTPRSSGPSTAGGYITRRGGGSVPPGQGPSANDNRSNARNPNNPSHRAAAGNRSNQMNPNNPAHRSSRGRGSR
jgi:hypothetical protein